MQVLVGNETLFLHIGVVVGWIRNQERVANELADSRIIAHALNKVEMVRSKQICDSI